MSRAGAECVRAPTLMRSTPVSAMSRMFWRVTPPEASSCTLAATALRQCTIARLSEVGNSQSLVKETRQNRTGVSRKALVPVELLLGDVEPEDYDALLLPGGAFNADALRMLPEVQSFVRAFQEAGKPMAVITMARNTAA